MRLRIFPPVATIYPLDRQKFTAEAQPPPPLWRGVTDSGDIKSDFSLEVDGAGSQVTGGGGHQLMSGIGHIEVTVDDQFRPTSTGFFTLIGFISDTAGANYSYTAKITATAVEVRDETNTLLYSQGHTLVSGDVYRLELNAGFRLYQNGVFLHQRTGPFGTLVYPMTYQMGLLEPTATAPSRIPPPRLIGDWRVGPIVEWIAPSHGHISFIGPDDSTEYYGGSMPGTYTLTARIESAADADNVQLATATIIIPPLQILGPTEVMLLPGQKVRFKTNYPDALIAWSIATGGGSFTQGEYTAASTPGTSLLRATADVNDQAANITVTVPAVITNVNNYLAAKPNEQIDFDSNIPASTMPSLFSGGSVASGTGNITPGMPRGVQEGDVLLIYVQSANEVVAAPSGYNSVADSPQGTGAGGAAGSVRLSVFWGRWVPGLPNPTITDPGDHAIAQILAVRGCPASGDPWDVTAGDTAASSTSVSIPGDTTTVNDCLIVLAVANATDTATLQTSGYTNAGLSSLTERADVNAIDGVGGGFAVATGGKATAGAFGATTATLATASAQARHTIALKPGSVAWSASAGSINGSSGLWTAPSLAGQTAKITVTNGFFTVTIEIPVLEAFPFGDFSLPVSWDRNLTALVSMSEDRKKRATRDKAPPFDSYPVKLTSRTLADCNAVDAFFDAHGFGKLFILEDKVRNIRKVGWFDSKIAHEARDECDIDLAFRFLEARL